MYVLMDIAVMRWTEREKIPISRPKLYGSEGETKLTTTVPTCGLTERQQEGDVGMGLLKRGL